MIEIPSYSTQSSKNDCLGVIIAGGLSSRMGSDKSQLLRNKTSMLNYSKQLLQDAGITDIVVSGDQYEIKDLVPNTGPLGGIYSVILQRKPRAILVLPIDLPLMNSACLKTLQQTGELSQQACFYQSQNKQQRHYLPLYLPVNGYVELFLKQAFMPLMQKKTQQKVQTSATALKTTGKAKNGPSIRALLEQIPHKILTAPQDQALFNTNTPEQWQQAKKHFITSSSVKRSSHV